jgi:hypothetical protein
VGKSALVFVGRYKITRPDYKSLRQTPKEGHSQVWYRAWERTVGSFIMGALLSSAPLCYQRSQGDRCSHTMEVENESLQ